MTNSIHTCCELPLCMLPENLSLNDYDFVLFHLYRKYPEYKSYFKQMRQLYPNRIMILDCSAYEFWVKQEELPMMEYIAAIFDLLPDYYILPDTLMNKDKTLEDSFKLLRKIGSVRSQPMGVLQGNSAKDFSKCLSAYIKSGVNAIAIPFHNRFFHDMASKDHLSEDMKYAVGRLRTLIRLSQHNKYWDKIQYLHLLGSHSPMSEKKWYSRVRELKARIRVDSADTGYPVKCGYEGFPLGTEIEKPKIIIDDFIEEDLSDDKYDLIKKNVEEYHNL